MRFADLVGSCAFMAHGDDEPGDGEPSNYGNDEERHCHQARLG
jgi:hypothetical protein